MFLSKSILLSLMTFYLVSCIVVCFEQVYFVKFNDLLFSFLHSCLFCL